MISENTPNLPKNPISSPTINICVTMDPFKLNTEYTRITLAKINPPNSAVVLFRRSGLNFLATSFINTVIRRQHTISAISKPSWKRRDANAIQVLSMRRKPESNRCIVVLQTTVFPLHHCASRAYCTGFERKVQCQILFFLFLIWSDKEVEKY